MEKQGASLTGGTAGIALDLSGRRALVTGGSRGIGRAIAVRLARAGAHVALNYLKNAQAAADTVACIRQAGGAALPVQGDVGDFDAAARMVQEAVDGLGGLDILVNNAGIWEQGYLGRMDAAQWRRTMRVNLDGVFACSSAVIAGMRRQRWGRIVNIASRAARKGEEGSSAYVASKAALLGFTRSAAMELGPDQITVNCVAPAWTASDMTDVHLARPGVAAEILRSIPLGRIATPDDVADTVVFLCSDRAAYITGETLFLTGGAY